MKRKQLILTVIALQILFLSLMIWFHGAKFHNAKRVLLKTVPYDPVSLFRGHYASLRYEISSLPATLLKDVTARELRGGEELYVLLKKEADLWQAQGIYRKQPKGGSEVYLKGRLRYYRYSGYAESDLDFEYGIESFFVNEDKAKELDRVNRGQGMNWRERDKIRQERLNSLDEEAKRINKAGISEWWLSKLDNELVIWIKEGVVPETAKDAIHKKYTQALERIKAVDKDLSSAVSPDQKPVLVEVAVDNNGNGYPLRLFVGQKEYR